MRRAGVELSVVVPVYNEERRLPGSLVGLGYALRGLAAEVIVVDNGSTDRTADVIRDQGFPVRLLHCADRGKGAAVRAGVLAAHGRFVGFCDADLAASVDALPAVLHRLRRGADAVLGSRSHPGSQVRARHSVLRQFGAWAFRQAVRSLVPGVGDTQCGFKFFTRDVAVAAFEPLRTTGFTFDVEVLARVQRLGAVIEEVPVRWIDVAGSTFHPLRHGIRSFTDLHRIRGVLDAETRPAGLLVPEAA
jgi:glycosyltransferase involved in cell wall biosynthesis